MTVHIVLLLAYCILQVLLGLWIGRRVRTTGDFFVAGRTLGPGLLFSTLVAANIGAGSTVGAAGLGYRDGVGAWWWVGSAGIGCLVLAFTVGPRMRRAAQEGQLHTVGDFLERRYHRGVRAAVALLLWLGTLASLAGQLMALAWILSVVAGVPKPMGCLVGGLVATTYFAAGGLLTSAWVNVVQVCVKLVGFTLALPVTLSRAGGWEAVVSGAPPEPAYWSPWSGLSYLALLAPAFVVSPGLLQKIYGARDDRAVRIGVGANAVVLLMFASLPPALGIIARALHPTLPHHELALPMLFMEDMPPLLGTLGLAAVVSAELSAADALLFMLATSLSQDLYRRFLKPAATDAEVLRVARLAAAAGGTLGVAIAIVSPTIIGALSVFYTLLTVTLFVPVVAGLYFRRLGTPEAVAAMLAGVALMLATHLWTGGRGVGPLSPALVGLLAAALGAGACALVRRGAVRGTT